MKSDAELLVIDVLDEDAGLADVEDTRGRTYQLPAEWLPGATDGAAYRVELAQGSVSFHPVPGGASLLRERSKQTLLEFHDMHEDAVHEPGSAPKPGAAGRDGQVPAEWEGE